MNYLPGLALSHDPPDLYLLTSYDYRLESPAPGHVFFLIGNIFRILFSNWGSRG
jgi:hypothetical protein